MPGLNQTFGNLQYMRAFQIFDDFPYYVDADLWTKLAADSATTVASRGDVTGGFVTLTTGGVDNNECAVATTNEVFLTYSGGPIVGVANVVMAEANTDDLNLAFGFSNVFGANLLLDDGAGPKTTGNHFLIYKVDGGTAWVCQSRNSTDVFTNTSSKTRATGGTAQTLRVEIKDYDSTFCQSTFFVDREQLLDATTLKPIVHTIPLASATEMRFGLYIKAGGANSEVIHCDYLGANQTGDHNPA